MDRRLLDPVVQVIQAASAPLSVPYWPYAILPVLHAARMSIAFKNNARLSGGGVKLGFMQDMTGYLLMCWGGQIIVHLLAGQPMPMLVSAAPWVVYPTVHLVLGILSSVIPSQATLDQLLFAVDALTRQATIVNAIKLAKSSSNLELSESLTAQIVLAALASAGGSSVASALCLWEPEWRLRSPASIRRATGSASALLPSLDLWSGALAGVIYSAATLSHPLWAKLFLDLGYRTNLQPAPFSEVEGRAIMVIFLSTVYAWRATQAAAAAVAATATEKEESARVAANVVPRSKAVRAGASNKKNL